MKKLALAFTVILVLVPGTAHAEEPDITQKVEAGTTFNWDGSTAVGLNVNYWALLEGVHPTSPGTCSDDTNSYCDTVLFEFSNPLTQEEIDAGKTFKNKTATVTVNEFGPVPDPVTDFDMIAFESDEQGTKGSSLGQSSDFGPDQAGDESISFPVRTTVAQPSKFVLVEIVYFAVVGSNYKGIAAF